MMKDSDNSLLSSKKKLIKINHLSEFLAEYTIKSVAFISFAVIILIFVFVFREALPIFSPEEKTVSSSQDLKQETYGEDPEPSNNNQA